MINHLIILNFILLSIQIKGSFNYLFYNSTIKNFLPTDEESLR